MGKRNLSAHVLVVLFASIIIALAIATPSASAEILIGQPGDLYNVGDELKMDITLKPLRDVDDFLDVNLVCGESSVPIYKESFSLSPGEERAVDILLKLTRSKVGAVSGNCVVGASYGGESSSSQKFLLTEGIDVLLSFDTKRYSPGDEIKIQGKATKLNGLPANGFVEVTTDLNNLFISKVVSEGEFGFNFTLPEDSSPGEHSVFVRVYERESSGETSNDGNATQEIDVKETLRRLEISTNQQSIAPGDGKLEYLFDVYDQANNRIERDVSYTIYRPGDFVFLKKLIKSGETETLEIGKDFSPGYWKIEASTEDVSARKLFYVEEIEEALFSLINNTLIISNLGNVPYKKDVEITIGDDKEIRQISLEVEETKEFRLSAPDGDYFLRIYDGSSELEINDVPLTGKAIEIGEINKGLGLGILWLALAIIIVLFAMAYLKTKKKNRPLTTIKNKIAQNKKAIASLQGVKEEAVVVSLNVKNFSQRGFGQVVDQSLLLAKNSGAKIYVDGEYRIMMFSPSLSKTPEAEIRAIKSAKEIERILQENNMKLKFKLDFGIGINRGQIIVEKKMGQVKFTSMGTLISSAKRISFASKSDILLSDSVHKKFVGSIKDEKSGNYWKLSEVIDREKHKGFLSKFKGKE